MQVVINTCFGGFRLSESALRRLHELRCSQLEESPVEKWQNGRGTGLQVAARLGFPVINDMVITDNFRNGENRADPFLVQVVNELGADASDALAKLKIVDVPDDVEWEISEYDGFEHVAEKHRTWN